MTPDLLLILSGGMDSTTLLYERKDRIALAVTFDYGQRHFEREAACAAENCRRVGVAHAIVPITDAFRGFRSALLTGSSQPIPDGHYTDESMRQTVVPFRNGILLSVAAGMAESAGLIAVAIANHAGDHTIYPDCRPEFIVAMNDAIVRGTDGKVRLSAPYTNMTKRGIALMGKENGVPYEETWSCYKGGDIHCGVCGTCVERKEALQGFDPTRYAA